MPLMNPLFWLIHCITSILTWIIIISVIASWLVAFNVLNIRQPLIGRLYDGLNRLTERLYAPIRKIMPTVFGGMDISPIIFLLGLQLIDYTLIWLSSRFGL